MDFKFGTLINGDRNAPFLYPKLYELQTMLDGSQRLAVAASQNPIKLLQSLLNPEDEHFAVLYVLKVDRVDNIKPGRYQSPWISHDQVTRFLDDFKDFFESDARHDIWIMASPTRTQIVYDKHEILYFYGDFQTAKTALADAGFREGQFEIPCPHYHSYNPECDAQLSTLMELDWEYFPLMEQDED